MAHERIRHALNLYQALTRSSPLVGVFGHRQVGKTTFVSGHVDEYVSFDDEQTLRSAEANPKQFLIDQASNRTAIDECQYVPRLFPALKEWVRTHKAPGQFVLTGSVRFSSRKAIRESLTGRLASLELFPMDLSEILKRELPDHLPRVMAWKRFDDNLHQHFRVPSSAHHRAFLKYCKLGGMPGLCFQRDPRNQLEGLKALIDLTLDRDLRLVTPTRLSLETLRRFLAYMAKKTGSAYRYAECQRELRLSEATQKALLLGLEAIFLLRRIPFLGSTGSKGMTFFLEDQFEESVLAEDALTAEQSLVGALYRNLRVQLAYLPGCVSRAHIYATRSGALVPLVWDAYLQSTQTTYRIGLVPLTEDRPNLSQRRSVDSFLRHSANAKVLYVSPQRIPPLVIDPRSAVISAAALLV